MADDDLRAQLTRAIRGAQPDVARTVGGFPAWTCDTASLLADALTPVIRTHLAAEWDAGYRSANPTVPQARRDVVNPWKQPGRG